eukprot:scaffold130133_cov13-Tisochrysis_lutea.AAC.1
MSTQVGHHLKNLCAGMNVPIVVPIAGSPFSWPHSASTSQRPCTISGPGKCVVRWNVYPTSIKRSHA